MGQSLLHNTPMQHSARPQQLLLQMHLLLPACHITALLHRL
jgi:hypothetical protein